MRIELNVLRGLVTDGMIERKKQEAKNENNTNLFDKICSLQLSPPDRVGSGQFTFAKQTPESDAGEKNSLSLLNQSPLDAEDYVLTASSQQQSLGEQDYRNQIRESTALINKIEGN